MNNKTYQIVLIGDKETGKSAYCNYLKNYNFQDKYISTLGADVVTLVLKTNYGNYKINLWDTAGDERYAQLSEGYYVGAHGCLAFYTSNSDNNRTDQMIKKYKNLTHNNYIVSVWSKHDLEEEVNYVYTNMETSNGLSLLQRYNNYDISYISTKNSYNVYEPLQILLRKMTGYSDLIIQTE